MFENTQQIPIDKKILDAANFVTCFKCGSEEFRSVEKIKVISKIAAGSKTDMLVPISAMQCIGCKHVFTDGEMNDMIEVAKMEITKH